MAKQVLEEIKEHLRQAGNEVKRAKIKADLAGDKAGAEYLKKTLENVREAHQKFDGSK